ncbi:cyclophane-forming radical SAM/SPASM peptide maturase GrrM/OscB [Micromonospora sp. IBSANI012]|uniref:cyclophane-forming radical SAM/SPASM peptide maturase GrrM/OscB n=1 Tax=Micromonospora sp. IBSANI012 TaxID=3457761 RepID=UPI004058E1AE
MVLGMPSVRPSLVILQPTARCNLNCSYCYLPDRRDRGLMSDEVLDAAASFVFACDLSGDGIEFLWHAGEPLAAGLAFYERAFALIAERAPAGLRVRHILQMNGTLLNQAWCDLFVRYQVETGLSVDGPAEIHDANRRTWSGRATHAKVMKSYHLLRRNGLSPGALSVLTSESLRWPDRMYEFFRDAGFRSVGFNVEESEGVYRHSRLRDMDADQIRASYDSFMRRMWQRWRADGSEMIIREFHEMLGGIMRVRQEAECVREPLEAVPFSILTIRRDGQLSTFSPELASTPSGEYGNFIVGNVLVDTPSEVARGAEFGRLRRDVAIGQDRCRSGCEYYALCGGGFQSNRFTEHGSFHATETLTCRLHRQTLADVVVGELASESRRLRSGKVELTTGAGDN